MRSILTRVTSVHIVSIADPSAWRGKLIRHGNMTLTKSSDHNKNHGAHDKCNKIEVSNEKIYGNEKIKKQLWAGGQKI